MRTHLITGAAGFIGSYLAKYLLQEGNTVLGVDNFTLGKNETVCQLKQFDTFKFIELDLSSESSVEVMIKEFHYEKIDVVWHMAANSDIRGYINGPQVDINNTFMTTVNVSKFVDKRKINTIVFASSSAVLGSRNRPLQENDGPALPQSYYGAMKLASEGYISATKSYFLKDYYIFRFPNVVGPNMTHGVIFDFIEKLKVNNSKLDVLGDGNQRKPYIHVEDLTSGMLHYIEKNLSNEIFNITPNDSGIKVKRIAELVSEELGVHPKINYENKEYGWLGDVTNYSYDNSKQLSNGWSPKFSTEEAIKKSIKENLI
jgi:UDP-glucose 4-epimerase